MTKNEMMELARRNVDRHLGDCNCESDDDLYDNTYTLAFDALHDKGISDEEAREVAKELATSYVTDEG